MTSDNKEHHFCFAYHGDRMKSDGFEALKFMNAQGTSTLDGVQMVRITLQRRNGRRSSTIHKIIEQYNQTTPSAPIVPIRFGGFEQPIFCFKLAHPLSMNPILSRIEVDKEASSPRYWTWTSRTAAAAEPGRKKPKQSAEADDAALAAIVERMIAEERGIDASGLHLPNICREVRERYSDAHSGWHLSLPPSPDDREFIRSELTRYIDREMAYMVLPHARKQDNQQNAHALTDDASLMDGLLFKDDAPAATAQQPPRPNETMLRYLNSMLPQWKHLDTVTVSAAEVASALSQHDAGLYRHTCVTAFMRPFILDGSVETADNLHFEINVQRVARKIE